MFKVSDKLKLPVDDKYCVSVEGDTSLLKKGLTLIDEKENVFMIESVGMTHFQNVEDFQHSADLLLSGDVENIGKYLSVLTT